MSFSHFLSFDSRGHATAVYLKSERGELLMSRKTVSGSQEDGSMESVISAEAIATPNPLIDVTIHHAVR